MEPGPQLPEERDAGRYDAAVGKLEQKSSALAEALENQDGREVTDPGVGSRRHRLPHRDTLLGNDLLVRDALDHPVHQDERVIPRQERAYLCGVHDRSSGDDRSVARK